jgi:hypothetical protein
LGEDRFRHEYRGGPAVRVGGEPHFSRLRTASDERDVSRLSRSLPITRSWRSPESVQYVCEPVPCGWAGCDGRGGSEDDLGCELTVGFFGGGDDGDGDGGEAESLARVAAGGIPSRSAERLQALAADGSLFTSELSVNEFALFGSAGACAAGTGDGR